MPCKPSKVLMSDKAAGSRLTLAVERFYPNRKEVGWWRKIALTLIEAR